MSQATETKRIVSQFMELLLNRDYSLADLFTQHRDWHIQENEALAPWLGKRNTKEQVKEFFLMLWFNTEPVEGNVKTL